MHKFIRQEFGLILNLVRSSVCPDLGKCFAFMSVSKQLGMVQQWNNEQMQRRKWRDIDIGEPDIEVACVRVEKKNIAVLFHLYFVTKNGVNCRSAVSKNWKCEMHKLAILAKLFKFFLAYNFKTNASY